MRFGATIFLALGTILLATAATGETTPLGFRPTYAEYSDSLDRIVFVSSTPNQLHIFDPHLQADVSIDLSAPPVALSLSADGRFAAVGHQRTVSYIDLVAGRTVRTAPTSVDIQNIRLIGDYIFYFSYNSTGGGSISIVDGSEKRSSLLFQFVVPTAEPDTVIGVLPDSLTNGLIRVKVANGDFVRGTVRNPSSDEIPVNCGQIWAPANTNRIYTSCGAVFSGWPESLVYPEIVGQFDRPALSVADRAGAATVAALHRRADDLNAPSDSNLTIYNRLMLRRIGTVALSPFREGNTLIEARGQWVFGAKAEGTYYVVSQAASGGLLHDFQLETIDIGATGTPPCATSVEDDAVQIAAYSDRYATSATVLGSCPGRVESQTPWIVPLSGEWVPADGRVRWLARANHSATPRSGEIRIGDRTVVVTQSGIGAPLAVTPVGVDIVATRYSRSRDRLIVAVTAPAELGSIDPETGVYEAIPIPINPTILALSRDGETAVAANFGWLVQVDLRTGTVVRTVPTGTDAGAINCSVDGYVYVFPAANSGVVFRMRLSDGAWARISITDQSGTSGLALARYRGLEISPDGKTFYASSTWGFDRIELSGSDLRRTDDLALPCGQFWLTPDATRGVTSCTTWVRVVRDGQPVLEVEGYHRFWAEESADWVDMSGELGAIAVTSTWSGRYFVIGENDLEPSIGVWPPSMAVTEGVLPVSGRAIFWGRNSTRLVHVVAHAVGDRPDTARFGIHTVDLATPAPGCTFELSPSAPPVLRPTLAEGALTLTAGDECFWLATSNANWLKITAGKVGRGLGTIRFEAQPNPTFAPRSTTISVGGRSITITQEASAITLAPEQSRVFLSGIDNATIEVTTPSPDTAWSATATAAWISITSDANGTGPGTIRYSIAPNPGPTARSGSIQVAGTSFLIEQTVTYAAPTGLSSSGRGSFRWDAVPGHPANYRLMVSVNPFPVGMSTSAQDCSGCVVNEVVNGTEYSERYTGSWRSSDTYYWTVNARGGDFTGEWANVAQHRVPSETIVPAVVFRMANGEIGANRWGESAVRTSGGKLSGEPSVAWNRRTGLLHVAARDENHGLWLNSILTSGEWGDWKAIGGIMQGTPSAPVSINSYVYIAVRDLYNAYWLATVELTAGHVSWTYLGGVFSTDPAMAISSTGSLCIVGRDTWGGLWSWYKGYDRSSSNWVFGGGITVGKPSVVFGEDANAYIAARDTAKTIWTTHVRGDGSWGPWQSTGGLSESAPQLLPGFGGGKLSLTIVDPTGASWVKRFSSGYAQWDPWVSYGGIVTSMAASQVTENLTMAGWDSLGNLWWNDGTGWTKQVDQLVGAGPVVAPQ